jgi:exopolysaccharide production protein ExoY
MSILESARHLTTDSFSTAPLGRSRGRDLPKPREIGNSRPILRVLHKPPSGPMPQAFSRGTMPPPVHQQQAAPRRAFAPAGDKPIGGLGKRGFDIAVAVSALIVMAPLMIIVALAILVTMGRPVIFIQQRVGFGGAAFGCFKFRSMVVDAEERLARYLAGNGAAALAWAETQKLKHDPRITWLGHILRKTSLDELPQLFNILRGDMSCVGPRPVLASELAEHYGIHARDYAAARPGLTGMWQVSGRSNTTYAQRVNCDRFYVRRWSPALDLMILLRTLPAVLRVRETA